jgi:hypothetical protein
VRVANGARFNGHGEISLAEWAGSRPPALIVTGAVTMSRAATEPRRGAPALARKILCKCGFFKFDETSHRIRVDFGQNPRFIANDSFNAVC